MTFDWIAFHDSHQLLFRRPFGAIPTGERLTLSLWVREDLQAEVLVHIESDSGEGNRVPLLPVSLDSAMREALLDLNLDPDKGRLFRAELQMPLAPNLYWYYFILRSDRGTYYYGNQDSQMGGSGRVYEDHPSPYQITLYRKGFTAPDWFKEAIVYQIFVDRFLNGNDDGRVLHPKKNALLHARWEDDPLYIRDEKGRVIRWNFYGGNLLGVLKKLPYLKELGVTVLYLNPIFESVSNHKYDTGDYHKIDPMYGDEALFRRLCEEAEKLGIHILLDGVFSHTGSNSKYFNKEGEYDSVGAYQSPESPYYSWYRFTRYPDEYESWWGIETMPNVNETDPGFMDYIIEGEDSVLKHWHRAGIAGWRFDVADELPDPFIERFRQVQKEVNPQSVLIGEVWEDASNKISYGRRRRYLLGDQFDSIMNYPLRHLMIHFILGKINGSDVYRALYSLYENYPREVFYSLLNMIGTHDTPRIRTVMKAEIPLEISDQAKEYFTLARFRLLLLWQFTFPGVPHLYYGDEAGIEGMNDPDNRRTFPWGKENRKILSCYKRMIRLRRSLPPFHQADWEPFAFGDEGFGYRLVWKALGKALLVLLNRNMKEDLIVNLPTFKSQPKSIQNLLTGDRIVDLSKPTYTLHPLEGAPLLIEFPDPEVE